MNNTPLYPWQKKHWEQFLWLKKENRIPQAILISGVTGLGKMHFAQQVVRALFCANTLEPGFACGKCKNCALIDAGNHPDYQEILSEDKHAIKIEEIRAMQSSLAYGAQQNGWRVIIVSLAEHMTLGASNAILKILEEPPQKTLFLLLTTSLTQLPATIRSRCEKWICPGVPEEVALSWLKENCDETDSSVLVSLLRQHNHAPLAVLNLLANKETNTFETIAKDFIDFILCPTNLLQLSQRWSKGSLSVVLHVMQLFCNDILRFRYSGKNAELHFCYRVEDIQMLSKKINEARLFSFYDVVKKMLQDSAKVNNLNKQLVMERLLLQWR